jgi:hypothetical protein
MERKAILEVKSAKGRQVHAVIATLDQPDADRDTIRAGFFPQAPMESLVVPAHKWDATPLGKAFTYQRGGEVHSVLTFNGTAAAAEWFEAIAHDFETGNRPLQQYSWGFKPHVDAVTHTKGGRELHARPDGSPGVQLFEVSPVLVAASVGTRTTAIKSAQSAQAAHWRALEARLRRERIWRS